MTRVSLKCLSDGTFSLHNPLKRKDTSTIAEYDDSWCTVSLDEQITPHCSAAVCPTPKSFDGDVSLSPHHTYRHNQQQRKRRRTSFCDSPSSLSPNSPSLDEAPPISEFSSDFFSDAMCDEDSSSSFHSSSSPNFDHTSMLMWFSQYADRDNDSLISGQNWERFKSDCGFRTIMDLRFFIFAYSLDCSSKDQVTRGEWVRGMYALKCDSRDKLHTRLEELIQYAQQCWTPDHLKQLFTFVFRYLRESNASRTIDSTTGAHALSCLIHNRFSKSFVDFLLSNQCKRLNLDQFRIFIDFSRTYENDTFMSTYDPNDAFPCIYDSFVEFFRTTELGMKPVPKNPELEEQFHACHFYHHRC